MTNSAHQRSEQAGFSMIEVLVSMLIISLALLGSAGLQAYALKTNQGGQFRNQAAFYLADIGERMEANKLSALAGSYVLVTGGAIPAKSTVCDVAACAPAALAQYDLDNWQANLASAVPGGNGAITLNGTTATTATYTVVVNWQDRRTDTTYAASSVTEPFSITTSKTIRN